MQPTYDQQNTGYAENPRVEIPPSDNTRQYWLIAPGEQAYKWNDWYEESYASIGWGDVGDLSRCTSKDDLVEIVSRDYPQVGKKQVANMLWRFSKDIKVGDVLFAKLGNHKLCGWGIVTEVYHYDEEFERVDDDDWVAYPHLIDVDWKVDKEISLPSGVQLPTRTFTERKHGSTQLQVLLDAFDGGQKSRTALGGDSIFLESSKLNNILRQLERKKNIVLQGAPGTGKTFVAKKLAEMRLGDLDSKRIQIVQFHQSTSYEDFVQGYKPDGSGGFELRDGAFVRFCRAAMKAPDLNYVYVIDEINRGNLSKVFGELMMLLEHDKRGTEYGIPLTYARSADQQFSVPPNVYLIGTMNTADRSLSMVDYALRRRFSFITMEPAFGKLKFKQTLRDQGVPAAVVDKICQRMQQINDVILRDPTLGPGFCIGHSFFMPNHSVEDSAQWYSDVVEFDIKPLLEEYFYDDLDRCESLYQELLLP